MSVSSTFRGASCVAALCVLVLLSGCATDIHQPLSARTHDSLRRIDVLAGVGQSEIIPTTSIHSLGGSLGLVGGFLDAIVNDARIGDNEELIAPLRDAMLDFDFDAFIQSQARDSLRDLAWTRESNPTVIKGDLLRNYTRGAQETGSDGVLLLTTFYALSNDFSEVWIYLFPALMNPMDAGKGRSAREAVLDIDSAEYRNMIVVTVDAGLDGDEEENVQAWQANDGKLAERAVRAGLRRALDIVAIDLPQVDGNVTGSVGAPTHRFGGKMARVAYKDDTMSVYRVQEGTLLSMLTLSK